MSAGTFHDVPGTRDAACILHQSATNSVSYAAKSASTTIPDDQVANLRSFAVAFSYPVA